MSVWKADKVRKDFCQWNNIFHLILQCFFRLNIRKKFFLGGRLVMEQNSGQFLFRK